MLMSVKEAAESLRLSRATLHNLIREGRIESIQIGRRRLFRPEALERFVSGCLTSTSPKGPIE
jgi:excisionase family DNA binding protein